jgi:SOUL heme-binding protein
MNRIVPVLLALGMIVAAPQARAKVEEPEWTLVHRDGAFELRDYAAVIVAETRVEGERNRAINEGFRRLARYIFGGNVPNREIAMTAPVMQGQDSGRKIAMTAPVAQAPASSGWTVAFIMPRGSRLAEMPAPLDGSVVLREQARRRVAALRFSGVATQASLDRHAATLREALAARGETPLGPMTYAFYDPPWTLPWVRRNEVMVEVRAG